jgi:hypothetical protein
MTAPTLTRKNWRFIALQRSDAGMGEGVLFNPLVGLRGGKLVTFPLPESVYQVNRIGQTVDDPREWCNGLVIIGVDVPGLDTIPDDIHGDDFNAAFQKRSDMIITEAQKLLRAALDALKKHMDPGTDWPPGIDQ